MDYKPIRSRRNTVGNGHFCIFADVHTARSESLPRYHLQRTAFSALGSEIIHALKDKKSGEFQTEYTLCGNMYIHLPHTDSYIYQQTDIECVWIVLLHVLHRVFLRMA